MTGHGVLAELEEARAGSTGRATGAELAARFPARVPLSRRSFKNATAHRRSLKIE